MGVIADYGKHEKGNKDCYCLRCCKKVPRKAMQLIDLLEKGGYIEAKDIIGVHPCNWIPSDKLLKMSNKKFDKIFSSIINKTMDETYGDDSNHICCSKCGMCIDCNDCKKYGCR